MIDYIIDVSLYSPLPSCPIEITINEEEGTRVTSEIITQSVSYNECSNCSRSKSYEVIVKFKVQADCHNCPGCPKPTPKLISTTTAKAATTPKPTTTIPPRPTPPPLGPSCDGKSDGHYSIAKLIPLFITCEKGVKSYEVN